MRIWGGVETARADITTGLVGHYKFDDGSGDAVTDSVGGYNGARGSAVQWVTGGQINKSLSFGGTGSDYVILGNNPAISPGAGNTSISLWFKTSTDFTSGAKFLYHDTTNNSGGDNSSIEITITTANKILGYIRDYGYNTVSMTSASVLNDGNWHHVVLERNGTTGLLYIDSGTPVTSTNALLATISTDAAYEPGIGAKRTTLTQNFTGVVDDVRIYSRALSTGDVAELHNQGLSPFVSVQAGSNISNVSVTLNGTIITDGGLASTTDRGFYYGLTTAYGFVASTTGTFNLGAYTQNVSNLTCNTTYHFASFATNLYGTGTSTDTTLLTSACSGIPTITMTLPVDNSTVSNTILLSADAGGDYPITSVQFKYGNTNIGAPVTSSPYAIALNTNTLSDGNYSIVAVATNSLGTHATSSPVTITTDNSNHWYSLFTPIRQFYVSSNGTGDGTSMLSPMSLAQATSTANPGDEYWFLAGKYENGANKFIFSRAGTEANPVVYRAMPGQHVNLNGSVNALAAYNWFWGFDITDTNGLATGADDGLYVKAAGVRGINNTIHDLTGGVDGIGGWNDGPGQVFYGNVIYGGTSTPLQQRGHLVYTQNNYADNGYKYYINNILMNPPLNGCNLVTDGGSQVISASDCYAFHGYGTSVQTQGFDLRNNIIANGKFLIGGHTDPADHEIVKGNYFYNPPSFQLGYTKQSQVEFVDNYIGKGNLLDLNFWGAGEIQDTQYAPNVFTGNKFYNDSAFDFSIGTLAYTASGKEERTPALQGSDIFNNNTYSSLVHFWLYANNVSGGHTSLSTWQSASAAAGNEFDTNSEIVLFPPADEVVVIPNEYESGRGNIAVYNWSGSATKSVNLSTVLTNGSGFSIYDAEDMWGIPLVSGIYSGASINIPTNGSEFLALVILPYSSPSVTFVSATDVITTETILNSSIDYTGGTNSTIRGFAYSTDSSLATVIATTTESGIFGTGAFTSSLTSLTCATTYYARAYATNIVGTGYGDTVSFTTSPCTSPSTSSYGSVSRNRVLHTGTYAIPNNQISTPKPVSKTPVTTTKVVAGERIDESPNNETSPQPSLTAPIAKTITTLRNFILSKLTTKEKELIPEARVIAKSSNLPTYTSTQEESSIHVLQGKSIDLAVKTDKPVKEVVGYLTIKKIDRKTALNDIKKQKDSSNLAAVGVTVEDKLVLETFKYSDPDNDGIYTATITAPKVHGEYDIMTILEYKDIKLGYRELHMTAVVDPEGYVYKKTGGVEGRIPEAVVTIFKKNIETNQFETWQADQYKQTNPQTTDKTGAYSFLVPEGIYKLTVITPGYKDYIGNEFEVVQGAGVHENIELKKKGFFSGIFEFFSRIF
ncbi:MAG: LamG-like jellyroll fold domain-containing protein [Candidatus Paceibacterota bacterium]